MMDRQELVRSVLELPEDERLDLARRIIASIAAQQTTSTQIAEAIAGIEDIVTGKIAGLTEAEFRAALG